MRHLKLYEDFTPVVDNLFYKFSYVHKSCGKGMIWNPQLNSCQTKDDFIDELIKSGLIQTDKPLDKYLMNEIVNILYKSSRVFKDGYIKSLHSRYKDKASDVTESLDRIARETKYGFLDRAKPAIESWFKLITPIISEINKKTWIESSDGRKWSSDLGRFEVYCELLIDLQGTEELQVKIDELSSNIFFYGGRTKIKEYSEDDINTIVNILKKYPTIRVQILGWHNTPILDPGQELIDLKRAEAVKDMLASKGIDKSRMTAEGKGESKIAPSDIYDTNEHGDLFNKNMRVDIKIVK